MASFKCKMCGGALEFDPSATVAECPYCGTKQTLPRLDDDRKSALYDRASHFRRGNEFDKAAAIYEQILDLDSSDAEAYWSLVLCRYGIEYVEDPATHKRLPTVNRVQYTSIYADENYKSALQNADPLQKEIYASEAKEIDSIQKGYLEISRREAPFDVFICYKETDENGRRTPDSVLAADLYHQLTEAGYKVFYSRITLEDKLGSAYEPYIFAALNSAKVMVVMGTRPEYFNAVWVKNEWSRYLALIGSGEKKMLIPAYRGMDPYDLPEEFSHLQALNMDTLGFMFDLIRGIQKIIGDRKEGDRQAPQPAPKADVSNLLKRVSIFMENQDWINADSYCEKVLDLDPENPKANLCKLLVSLRVSDLDELERRRILPEKSPAYHNAIRYGDPDSSERLVTINHRITEQLAQEQRRNEEIKRLQSEQAQASAKVRALAGERDNLIRTVQSKKEAIQNHDSKKALVERKAKGLFRLSLICVILIALFLMLLPSTIAAEETGSADGTLSVLMGLLLYGWFAFNLLCIAFCVNLKRMVKELEPPTENKQTHVLAIILLVLFIFYVFFFFFLYSMWYSRKVLKRTRSLSLEDTVRSLKVSQERLQDVTDRLNIAQAELSKSESQLKAYHQ